MVHKGFILVCLFILGVGLFVFLSQTVLAAVLKSNYCRTKVGEPKNTEGYVFGCEGKTGINPDLTPAPGENKVECKGALAEFGVEKRLLPLPDEPQCAATQYEACGRVQICFLPTKIVLHTTAYLTGADAIYEYFASGSEGRGVGSHFMVGVDGKTLQMAEMFTDRIEHAYAVGGHKRHISIEQGSTAAHPVYTSKSDMSSVQYQATLQLVKKLMQQYKIPLGDIEWEQTQGITDDTIGVFGHYQIDPVNRSAPGAGWFRDFREDLKN